MTEGDYTYVLESAEDGEQHTFEFKDGVYRADGCIENDPIVQCLMDATLDLLLQQAEMVKELERHATYPEGIEDLDICDECSPHVHPGSGRSH
jgi:hypothetical protein